MPQPTLGSSRGRLRSIPELILPTGVTHSLRLRSDEYGPILAEPESMDNF
jgi:hypothetical protein